LTYIFYGITVAYTVSKMYVIIFNNYYTTIVGDTKCDYLLDSFLYINGNGYYT